jgi:membrane protein YqaA with SNARE-associated domain
MGLIWFAATALWGVAEATVFFIVPDVILTYAVVRFGFKAGVRLALVAAASASIAGIGMWLWGRNDSATAHHVMLMVPAIGPDLVARTARDLAGFWPLNLVLGAVTGVPYKLYAVAAGVRDIPLVWFVPASFVARLFRFLFSVGLTAAGVELLSRFGRRRWTYPVLTTGWVILYTVYFSLRAAAE